MLFNSLIFLYLFLPVCLLVVFLLPRMFGRYSQKVSNLMLLLFSLLFYAWGGVSYLAVLAGSILVNYLTGLAIGSAKSISTRKRWFILGVILNILLLVIFKYSLFIVNNINLLGEVVGINPVVINEIILPLGISFYTFKGISYLISVKREESPAQRNIISLALYVSVFPELIAGPIDRYRYLELQIRERTTSFSQFSSGVQRFCLGLFKKVIISTPLAYVADHIINNPAENLSTPLAWLGAISYLLQIYYDFSGYTDMAIGIGRMLGFEFSENFNFPYISRSVREFWKRWHITLSTWLRDYLFLPIAYSTSRKLTRERYVGIRVDKLIYIYATMITFLLCGFWHGAAWNFVVWGALHGIMLSLEHTPFGKWLGRTWKPVQHLYLIVFLMTSLIFFRTDSLPEAFGYLGVMFGIGGEPIVWSKFLEFFDLEFIFIGSIAALGATPFFQFFVGKCQSVSIKADGTIRRWWVTSYTIISLVVILLVLLLSTMTMISQTNTPFIYFKF